MKRVVTLSLTLAGFVALAKVASGVTMSQMDVVKIVEVVSLKKRKGVLLLIK